MNKFYLLTLLSNLIFIGLVDASDDCYKVNYTIDKSVFHDESEINRIVIRSANYDLRKIHVQIDLDHKKFSWDTKLKSFNVCAFDILNNSLEIEKIPNQYWVDYKDQLLELARLTKLFKLEFECRRHLNIKMTSSAVTEEEKNIYTTVRQSNIVFVNGLYKMYSEFLEEYKKTYLPLLMKPQEGDKKMELIQRLNQFYMMKNGRLLRFIQDNEK